MCSSLCTAGRSRDEVENSPFLEKLKRKDYEVIYFTDALDECVPISSVANDYFHAGVL